MLSTTTKTMQDIKKQLSDPQIDQMVSRLVRNASFIAPQRFLNLPSQRNIRIVKEEKETLFEEFNTCFNGEDLHTAISLEDYLERILEVEPISGSVFQIAGYIFYRVLPNAEYLQEFQRLAIRYQDFWHMRLHR